ncbi:MAG: hypothetical protein PHO66_00190 [Eubacteriales bacterium]|nr:hypothetical protein [Eubacteriales bacterium]
MAKKINTTLNMQQHAAHADADPVDAAGRITIRLPKAEGQSDHVEVGLNGKLYLIRRDSYVAVPEPIVHILRNAGMEPECL